MAARKSHNAKSDRIEDTLAKAGGAGGKQRAIELAVSSIEKQFGKGAIQRMTGDAVDKQTPCLLTAKFATGAALILAGIFVAQRR